MKHVELLLENDVVGDAAEVASYLEGCPILVIAASLDADPLLPGSPPAVPVGTASDGTYAWPLSVAYFSKVHGISPADELLHHVRSQGFVPPTLLPADVARLRAELSASSQNDAPSVVANEQLSSNPFFVARTSSDASEFEKTAGEEG